MAEYARFPELEMDDRPSSRPAWLRLRVPYASRADCYREMARRLLRAKGLLGSMVPPDFSLHCHLAGPVQNSGDLFDLVAELFARRDLAKGANLGERTFRALSAARRWGGTSVYASGKCRTVTIEVADAVQGLARAAEKCAA